MEHRNEESNRQCRAQYQAIVDFSPQLKVKMVDDSATVAVGVSPFGLHIYASDSTTAQSRNESGARFRRYQT